MATLHSPYRWAVVGAALSSLLASVPVAHAVPSIPPGHEAAVLQLFAPTSLGSEFHDGWRLATISIRHQDIEVTLMEGDSSVTARLAHPDAPASSLGDAPTRVAGSFLLLGPPEAPDSLMEALAARISQNDDGEFWAGMPESSGSTRAAASGTTLAGVAVLGVLLAGLFVVLRRRKAEGASAG